jgi:hypothetical protein
MPAIAAANSKPVYRRGEVFSTLCPSREILNHVTSRWGVLVLTALMDGTHRFSELRRKIDGVSEKMLVDVDTTDRKLGLRFGDIDKCAPLGLATWQTTSEVKNLRWRKVAPEAAQE